MEIKKFSHCTLQFIGDGFTILQDPGKYVIEEYSKLENLTHLIIADVHGDHLDKVGVATVLAKNPRVTLIITESVKSKLEEYAIQIPKDCAVVVITERKEMTIGTITAIFGLASHIPPYKDKVPVAQILWFTLGNAYFSCGDTYQTPPHHVKAMGINVVAPFGTTEEFVDHALKCDVEQVFNIHDGYTNKDFSIGFFSLAKKFLEEAGKTYTFLNDGDTFTP